jgi:hypothetical protein
VMTSLNTINGVRRLERRVTDTQVSDLFQEIQLLLSSEVTCNSILRDSASTDPSHSRPLNIL